MRNIEKMKKIINDDVYAIDTKTLLKQLGVNDCVKVNKEKTKLYLSIVETNDIIFSPIDTDQIIKYTNTSGKDIIKHIGSELSIVIPKTTLDELLDND